MQIIRLKPTKTPLQGYEKTAEAQDTRWKENFAKLYRKYNPKVYYWSEYQLHRKVTKAASKLDWLDQPYDEDELVTMIRDSDISLIHNII